MIIFCNNSWQTVLSCTLLFFCIWIIHLSALINVSNHQTLTANISFYYYYQSQPDDMALRSRRRSLRDGRFHRAGRSRHSSKAPLTSRTTSFVILITIIIKTYEPNVSCNLVPRSLADSERRPGFDADAPSGLLLPSADASAVQPLSAHCARPAAAVSGRVPLKPAPLKRDRNKERKGEKMEMWHRPNPSHQYALYCYM